MSRIARRALLLVLLASLSALVAAQSAPSSAETPWFTGPILAPGAGNLTPGHWLVEPYFYDVTAPGANGWGSLTYILYGLTPHVTLGLIPTVGYNHLPAGSGSAGLRFGDLGLAVQVGLTRDHGRIPALAINLEEVLPTGRFDRLGGRPGEGMGSGAWATKLALYSQKALRLPTGRPLRLRFNIIQTLSSHPQVHGVSVYGTRAGFGGRVRPGGVLFADLAWEYSLTQRWVLAMDSACQFQARTWIEGTGLRLSSGSSAMGIFAPALEYNWRSNWGVIAGARLIPLGRNYARSLTPVMAINYVR